MGFVEGEYPLLLILVLRSLSVDWESEQSDKLYFLGVSSGMRRVVPMGTLSASLMMFLLCFTI